MSDVLLCIPVINEESNLSVLLPRIFALYPKIHLIMVDDMSSDNTQELIENLRNNLGVSIFHDYSNVRRGIGNAHIIGMKYARENGYKYLVTMDGDLTHSPEYISDFIHILGTNPTTKMVIGSRFLESGRLHNWTLVRKFMTHGGHLLTRLFLGMKEDCSSGFRAYKVDNLPLGLLSDFELKSYDFFFKSAYIFDRMNLGILEISVKLNARYTGQSKMRISDVIKGVAGILIFRFRFLIHDKIAKSKGLGLIS